MTAEQQQVEALIPPPAGPNAPLLEAFLGLASSARSQQLQDATLAAGYIE